MASSALASSKPATAATALASNRCGVLVLHEQQATGAAVASCPLRAANSGVGEQWEQL
uniref:Uncharacterized protein n=2 Tax=Oryza TaxID=4527 RepID=A0A0D3FSM6_9ORYZ